MPIEIKARELDSKLLITHKMLDKGYSVILGTKGAVYNIARSHSSGIYFYKDHSPLSSRMLQELHVAGLKIVALDEEGLFAPSPDKYTKRIDKKVFQISDAIFVWGQKQYDILKMTLPEYEKKYHVVGNPRFDILHSKYRPFLEDQAKHHLSSLEKDYVLINSMFSAGNWNPLLYGTPTYVEHLRNRGIIKNDEDYNFYTKVSENTAKLFDSYVSLIRTLSNSFSNTKFIIRPHPDENQRTWSDYFSTVDNVLVKYRGSASYWILGSKVLIFSGCTTAIEAWAMDKPTLRYHPIAETKFEPYFPNQFGKTIKTEEEIVEELNVILKSNKVNRYDVDFNYVKKYIANGFTADAAENIVRLLDSIYDENGFSNDFNRFSFKELKKKMYLLFYFDMRKNWGTRLLGKFKRLFEKENVEKELKRSQAKAQKFSSLSRDDIEQRLISYDKVADKYKKQKREILQVAPKTFKIRNIAPDSY